MTSINISVEDAIIFERLLIENRDSAKLQRLTDCNLAESINKLNMIRRKLKR